MDAKTNCVRPWVLAMGGMPEYELPQRKMPGNTFLQWATERYRLCGNMLADCQCLPGRDIDWEFKVGFYRLIPNM
eukprot:9799844-Lingulodinium_polyedra.AAC.1